MSDCLGADELTTLSSALGWGGEQRLDHLASCPDCRALLRELTAAHAALAVRETPREEWLTEMQQLIDREAAIAVSGREAGSRPRIGVAALLFALAAAATMLLLLPRPGAPPDSFSPAVAAALSAIVGAVVAGQYTWRKRPG